MAIHSIGPMRTAAPLLAAPLLAALLLALPPASAQVAPVSGGAGKTQDAGGAAEAPALPEPLTRQAIRDVLSGLSDGQARELLLRELDRQVAAREAALAAAGSRGTHPRRIARRLGDGAGPGLGGGHPPAPPRSPGASRRPWTGSRPSRGDAGPWRVPGALVLCLLAGLAAALGARRLVRDTEARLDRRRPAGLWPRIGIITGRFLVQGAQVDRLPRRRACRRRPRQPRRSRGRIGGPARDPIAGPDLVRGDGRALRAGAGHRPHLRLCAVDDRTAWFLTWRIGLILRLVGVREQPADVDLGVRLARRRREPGLLAFGGLPRPHGADPLAGAGRHHRDGAGPRRARPGLEPLREAVADDRGRARRAPMAGRGAVRRHRQPPEPVGHGAERLAGAGPGAAAGRAGDPRAGRGDLARRPGAGPGVAGRPQGDPARAGALRADPDPWWCWSS